MIDWTHWHNEPILIGGLVVLGWLWAVLAIVIGRGRLGHPPVIAPERALDPSRRLVGWLAVVLFIVTFMPLPLAF